MEGMNPPHTGRSESGPDFEQVVGYCAESALAGQSLDETLAAFEQRLDDFMPPEADPAASDDPDLRRRLLRIMVRALWRILPNPATRFAVPDVPTPSRNSPCHCGSGRKFKHCCQPLEQNLPPQVNQINLLPILLEALPRERWPELAGSRVCLNRLGDTVREWAEEERWGDILALLGPWFARADALVIANGWLLDQYLDAMVATGDADGKAQMMQRALAEGDRPLRSAMLQRQASAVADQDRFAEAWELFEQARELDPRSPNLSHLEVIMLMAEGREEEARARARFWVGKLERRRKPELAGLIDLLRNVVQHGRQALLEADIGFKADDRALREALEQAPPVECRYELEVVDRKMGMLRPAGQLGEALDLWYDELALDEVEEIPFDAMLALLARHPILWDSFDVLAQLLEAADELLPVDRSDLPALRLGERAWALLDRVLAENLDDDSDGERAGDPQLPWGLIDNRPVLRALLHGVLSLLDEEPVPAVLLERLQRLLALNPEDNQGVRWLLCRAWIEAGAFDQALALCERFPDDLAELQYNRALALYALDQESAAAEALRKAVAAYPTVFQYLDPSRVVAPKLSRSGVTVGGDDEAWLYRSQYRHHWQRLGALAWARQILRPG